MERIMDNSTEIFRDCSNTEEVIEHQKIASNFWESCDNSYVSSEDLYNNQEKALMELFIPKLTNNDEVLDIGCSNGRFTFLASKYCKSIDAFDLSQSLIDFAKTTAENNNIMNVNFSIGNITELSSEKVYDHVMCMGVFTAIPDDNIVRSAISKFPQIIKKDGYLVVKDSVATLTGQLYVNNNYAAIYRNEKTYINMFNNIGMELVEEVILKRTFANRTFTNNQEFYSKLYIFKNKQ